MLANLRHLYSSYRWGEPELRLVGRLADPARLAIDVGGYDGEYTQAMRRHARGCLTFEPNPRKYARLRRIVGEDVRLFPVALSDHAGRAQLCLPQGHDSFEGCATLDPENPAYGHGLVYEVETVRLDDLPLEGSVGLMKVDVEGHELAVLRGARAMLVRDRPNLIVEAEERHRHDAVGSLRAFLEPLGYRGWFLHDRGLLPVEDFRPELHQAPEAMGTSRYALNFLWSVEPDFAGKLRSGDWSGSRLQAISHVLFG